MEQAEVTLDRLILPEHGTCIDCFVCLDAEYGPPAECAERFRQLLRDHQQDKDVELLYFPVYNSDASVPSFALIELIGELEQRLRSGRRIFIYCNGGYRRTCLVCLPLLCGKSSNLLLSFLTKLLPSSTVSTLIR